MSAGPYPDQIMLEVHGMEYVIRDIHVIGPESDCVSSYGPASGGDFCDNPAGYSVSGYGSASGGDFCYSPAGDGVSGHGPAGDKPAGDVPASDGNTCDHE